METEKHTIRCTIHGAQTGKAVDAGRVWVCPLCSAQDAGPEKRFITNMVLTLRFEDRVLIQIDAWYLILSAILRGSPPFSLNQALSESVLTATVEIGGEQFTFEVPQPPEFKGDSQA